MSHSSMWIGLSHLDYTNAILADLPNIEISKMQQIQNITAKFVMGADNYSSPTECRIKLHWLPVQAQIQYKVLLLVYKCVQKTAPIYLQELISVNSYDRVGLHSSQDDYKLYIPRVKRETFANRSFKVVGPRWWNNLPIDIQRSISVIIFKKQLKTHLFKFYYKDYLG